MFYQKTLWQRQQGHFSRNSALNTFLYILCVQSLIHRLNHQVSMVAFQSNFWQMTAQISWLIFLKFKTAFGVLHSSEKLANEAYLKLRLITRRETTLEHTNHSFLFLRHKTFIHIHTTKRCLMTRPKNGCGFLVGWGRKEAWFFF